MPKTTKPFDWEIYLGEDYIDMLSMSRNEMKAYRLSHPEYTIKEVGYTDDRDYSESKTDSQEGRNVHRIRVSRR